MANDHKLVSIEGLKHKLNRVLIKNNFDLQHPQVIDISSEISSLLVTFFHSQLPKAKIIKFPIK